MYNFLRNYRATPHATLKKAPAEILFSRNIKTRLSQITVKSSDKQLRHTDKHSKQKMKVYADERSNVQSSKLKIGDNVLVKQPKQNKLSTPFDLKPLQITDKKGPMVPARREDKAITRNSSFFKPIRGQVSVPPPTDEDDVLDTSTPDQPVLRRSERERAKTSYLFEELCL